ncbi:unannotated protein [freshwater metagenome]|uniref:Unannotated protein n=1 Tax=freshwater metagenome TaxID=449393 RepID=A0A6J6H4S3_9ZZZZ
MKDVTFRDDETRVNELRGHFEDISLKNRYREIVMDDRITDSERAMMERAKARHGSLGAMVFSGMLGLEKLLGREPKEEGAVIWEASGEPEDIDADGISIDINDETQVVSHPNSQREPRRIRKRHSSKTPD